MEQENNNTWFTSFCNMWHFEEVLMRMLIIVSCVCHKVAVTEFKDSSLHTFICVVMSQITEMCTPGFSLDGFLIGTMKSHSQSLHFACYSLFFCIWSLSCILIWFTPHDKTVKEHLATRLSQSLLKKVSQSRNFGFFSNRNSPNSRRFLFKVVPAAPSAYPNVHYWIKTCGFSTQWCQIRR